MALNTRRAVSRKVNTSTWSLLQHSDSWDLAEAKGVFPPVYPVTSSPAG
ncbi:MAG: hypothetical protein ACYCV7_04630 [Acidimicrobiales bacterium]